MGGGGYAWVRVAGSIARRLTAKIALAAAKACVRRMRVTTRTAGICAMTTKDVLTRKRIPIAAGLRGVWAFANGGRMLEKNVWPTTTSTIFAAITVRKSRSRATARKPVPLASVAVTVSARGLGTAASTISANAA